MLKLPQEFSITTREEVMKFAQLQGGKSYTNGKGSIRTIRQVTKENEVFYIEDQNGFVFSSSGQEFATWAKRECPQPAEHCPRRH